MTKSRTSNWLPFVYELPMERVAQRPVQPPEAAKLLVSRGSDSIEDRQYADLPDILRPGDLLVFNQTRVFPARIRGALRGGGAAEFLLLRRTDGCRWSCLARPLRKLQPGTLVECGDGLLLKVIKRVGDKELEVELSSNHDSETVEALLDRLGEMPIPPYIRKGHADQQDRVDYQSIFARYPGSVAAPTASLHFSQTLIDNLTAKGIENGGVVLHLGSASFLPVYDPESGEDLVPPGLEYYVYSAQIVERLRLVRQRGGRVIAVGTSVVRALETMSRQIGNDGELYASDLFITPGFEFQLVDVIITNFHQPGTTHLLLEESFVGPAVLNAIYSHALHRLYRFLSYGDGMILFPGENNG